MAEYIDRKAALEECDWYANEFCECEYAIMPLKGALENLSAADVRPVVRGKWKDAVQGCHDSPHVKCSVCGEYYWKYFEKFNFCPNCGAMMEES